MNHDDKYIVEIDNQYFVTYTERTDNITLQTDILADICAHICHATKFDTKEEAEHVSEIALYNLEDMDKPRKVWLIKDYIDNAQKEAKRKANEILRKTLEDPKEKEAFIEKTKEAGHDDKWIEDFLNSLNEGE